MYDLSQQVLRTDVSGLPLEWIGFQEAVRLMHLGQVNYAWGTPLYRIHGGINARSGLRSVVEIPSIVATRVNRRAVKLARTRHTPPLNNTTLFRRDGRLCLYCGEAFEEQALSRDHVVPVSQGGGDTWSNVVTACLRCNHHKGGRTPEQAGMQLLAVPFVPNHAEYIFLKGKRVLADQMTFLRSHFPRSSPLHLRLPDDR